MPPFPQATYDARRSRVLDALGHAAMVLPAAPIRYASRDTEYPYRPDSELFYVTGIAEPNVVVVLRGHAAERRFVLFARARDAKSELWSGPREGPEVMRLLHGADDAHPVSELPERLPGLLEGADVVYHRLGGHESLDRLVQKALVVARRRGVRKGEGPRGILDPGVVLDPMRVVKDDLEVEALRHAAQVSVRAHREVIRRVAVGMGEWELQAVVEHVLRSEGAEGAAFPIIVASGANACVLHYVANRSRIAAGSLVLVDAGASVGLYAGDLTRTFPVDGTFTAEQRAIYDVVERAHLRALEAVLPGRTVADVHEAAVTEVVEGLTELGVFRGDPLELVEEEAHQPFFPHQTSHFLGLDVHDPGDYRVDGASRVLEEGMVLTVEPGLYFGDAAVGGHEPAERFRGIGVRIEDAVLVTAEGSDVLTAGVPTGADEVAALVGSGAS